MPSYSDLNSFLNAFDSAKSGDEVVLKKGDFKIEKPIVLGRHFSPNNKVRVIFDESRIINEKKVDTGKYKPQSLKLSGSGIDFQGGKFSRGAESIIAIPGNDIDVSLTEIDGEMIATKGIFLAGHNNRIFKNKISNLYGGTATGIEGNGGQQDENGKILFGYYRNPQLHNWEVFDNEIFNIETTNYGNHEGAMKFVPSAKGLKVYRNYVHDCNGQGIWVDHGRGDISIHRNQIERVGGKSIFMEILHPDLLELGQPTQYGAIIWGNKIREGGQYGILAAASPYVTIIGNDIESWAAVGLHAMPRKYWDNVATKTLQRDATLWHNIVKQNRLKSLFHKAHVHVWDKENETTGLSGHNAVEENYYVTGYEAKRNFQYIDRAYFNYTETTGLNHLSDLTLAQADPTGMEGEANDISEIWTEEELGFADLEAGNYTHDFSDLKRLYDLSEGITSGGGNTGGGNTGGGNTGGGNTGGGNTGGGNTGGGNTGGGNTGGGNTGGGNTGGGSTGLGQKRVVISSDLSMKTDPDDWCAAAAFFLFGLQRVKLEAFIIGAHAQKEDGNLFSTFEQTFIKAFDQERQNLGYSGDMPAWIADMHQNKFLKYSNDSEFDINQHPVTQELISILEGGEAYFLNWGILNQFAQSFYYIERNRPELLGNIILISHATQPSSANNCRKDAGACEYVHGLGKSGKIKFYELGLSGTRVIDDRNKATGEMSNAVLNSAIGNFFKRKWLDRKPDFSDFITVCVIALEEVFGMNYLDSLESDGSDNTKKVEEDFKEAGGKKILIGLIEKYAKIAIEGDGSGGNTGGGNTGGGNTGGGTTDAEAKIAALKIDAQSALEDALAASTKLKSATDTLEGIVAD